MSATCTKLTPPAVARRYGVSPDKVLTWIRLGELRGVNIATNPSGRPRYVVDEADLAAFEHRRAVHRTQAPPRRRRAANVIEFF
jgi:hypothetical protein